MTVTEYFLVAMGSLLPIVNPLSTCPLFLSLTRGWSSGERRKQAGLACVYAFCILTVFLLTGDAIIDFFGISVHGIQIAGGLIIGRIGFSMLQDSQKQDGSTENNSSELRDIAFSPLAMPSLSGPGSITVVITIVSSATQRLEPLAYIGVLAAMFVTFAACFFALIAAVWLNRQLGDKLMAAITRIMGFILICIGVQFLLEGISKYVNLLG